MGNIAQAIGYVMIAIGVVTAGLGLMAYETGGMIALVYGASSVVSGVIISCLDNTARSAAAQERIAEKLGAR